MDWRPAPSWRLGGAAVVTAPGTACPTVISRQRALTPIDVAVSTLIAVLGTTIEF